MCNINISQTIEFSNKEITIAFQKIKEKKVYRYYNTEYLCQELKQETLNASIENACIIYINKQSNNLEINKLGI